MHIISLFSVLALNGVALATIDFNNWAPTGPGDVRGPCPAMNSLANHHIIPHDGRNVTVPHLVEVLGDVFNLSPELATVVSQLGLATAPDPTTGSFNLPDLDKHNAFEHDASLTRVDFAFSVIPGDAKLDHALFAHSCHISMAWIISRFLLRLQPDTAGSNPHVPIPQASRTLPYSRSRVMPRLSSTSGQWSILQTGLPLKNSSESCLVILSLFLHPFPVLLLSMVGHHFISWLM